MAPPQADSGSSGCPPATTMVSFGLFTAWASDRAGASFGRPNAAPVALTEFLSHLRRESVLILHPSLRLKACPHHGCSISSTKWRVTAPAISGPGKFLLADSRVEPPLGVEGLAALINPEGAANAEVVIRNRREEDGTADGERIHASFFAALERALHELSNRRAEKLRFLPSIVAGDLAGVRVL